MSKRKRGRYTGIRHKKGTAYEISYYPYPNAPRVWETIQAESLHEAHIKRAKRISQYGKDSSPASLPFVQLKARLEQKLRADNLTPKSILNYMGKFNKITAYLSGKGLTSINQVTKLVIEDYKQHITANQPTGWRDELTKLKTIIHKLVDIGCCEETIYTKVLSSFEKGPRHKKLYKDITKEQIAKLLKFIEKDRPDYYGITYVIARLGWRRSQVLSLKRHNIRWHNNRPIEIRVEPQDTKTKEPFILRDIDRELGEVIRRYATNNDSQYLFPNKHGRIQHKDRYTAYIKRISQAQLGITLTPHDFRHAFCTRRLNDGATPRDIMAVTGHRDIDSFNIYAHPTSDGTKKVIEKSRIF